MPLLFLYLRTLFLSLPRTLTLYLLLTLSLYLLSLSICHSPSFLTLSISISLSLFTSSFLSLYPSHSLIHSLCLSPLSLSSPLSVSVSLPHPPSVSLSLSLFTYLCLSLSLFRILSIFRLGRAVVRLGRWGGVTRVEWAENKSSYRERSYEQTALWYWKRDPAFAIQFNR